MRTAYITTFSLHNWKELSEEEKNAHTVRNCTACYEKFATFSAAFPTPKRRGKKPLLPPKTTNIQFLEQDLSSTNALGRKVLRELNTISQERFQTPGNVVLVETPKSNLAHKPTSHEKRKSKRTIERSMKNAIVKQKEEQASELVLQNRISWRTYDRLRKAEGLETCSSRKRLAERISDGEPRNKRRCTSLLNNTMVDKFSLLQEAQSWPSHKVINWSQLARDYGLQCSNGGQIIKEYLCEHGIPAASIQQRPSRAPRRCKKRVHATTDTTMPMYPTIIHEKAKLEDRISKGEIIIGDEVVPTTHDSFTIDTETHTLQANRVTTCGRRIRLRHIREKLLKKHEDMGIVRDNCDEYFANMTHEEVVSRLKELNIPFNESHDLRQKLQDACRTRYLKVWHDHSSIANHGYLLVLVSFIYDTAFYYTTQEMKDLKGISIDVPAFVQIPEVHIIARSSSSTQDQLLFIDVRKECIEEMSDTLKTTAGVEVHDIVRFFYGDGPAAQFEAGQKQGGSYCCVGCGAHSGRFSI